MKTVNRAVTIALAILAAFYLPWLLTSANWSAPWLTAPFVAASALALMSSLLHGFNNWSIEFPALHRVRRGAEPRVAVLIPTYGEPVAMVERTVRSVLSQDYPTDRLVVVVSDDAHSDEMRAMTLRVAEEFSDAEVLHVRPYLRGDDRRRGDGKAGNLNYALAMLTERGSDVDFVETRDCDDLVGDRSFLRVCVGQLLAKPTLGFVQTVKTAEVADGDPFGNQNTTFFRRSMFARNVGRAVFPCGSGLLWRRVALDEIGWFPTWNLVEDVQSGIEAMRRGWTGEFLGLVGARAQIAPEDLPNVFKQRGVWALDSMRLMFWGSRRGLTLRQRLHFHETSAFYLTSFARVTLSIVPIVALSLGIAPLKGSPAEIALRVWPVLLLTELLYLVHAHNYGFEGAWRARQIDTNLSFLWIVQVWRALRAGPNHKPAYRVTRKVHRHQVYLASVAPQILISAALVGAMGFHLSRARSIGDLDLTSLYWGLFFLLFYVTFIPRAWFRAGPQLTAGRLGSSVRATLRRVGIGSTVPFELTVLTGAGTVDFSTSAPARDLRRSRDTRAGDTLAGGPVGGAVPAATAPVVLHGFDTIAVHGLADEDARRATSVVVIGGGIGGLATAWLAAERGYDVTLYEAAEQTGGLARSFNWHGVDCDLGPHRFYPNDPALLEHFAALAPLRQHRRKSRLRLANRWIGDPINPLELLLKLPPTRSAKLVWGFLRRPRNLRTDNFDAHARARYGDALNDLFFKPYSEKLFGVPAEDIAASWAERKLRLGSWTTLLKRNSKLYFDTFWYPEQGGYGAFAAALKERVGPGRIRLGHRLVALDARLDGGLDRGYRCYFDNGGDQLIGVDADHVVAALPVTYLMNALGQPITLGFRPLDIYYLHIARPRFMEDHWMYFADGANDHAINRVTDFTNFGGVSDEPGTCVICCEVTATEVGSLERVISELVEQKLLTDSSEVLDHRIVHVPHAYPVFDVASDRTVETVAALLVGHPRLYRVGRSAGFAHHDVDDVFVDASDVVDTIERSVAVVEPRATIVTLAAERVTA